MPTFGTPEHDTTQYELSASHSNGTRFRVSTDFGVTDETAGDTAFLDLKATLEGAGFMVSHLAKTQIFRAQV